MDENKKDWVLLNLPKDCPCITLFMDRETAEADMARNGSKPLLGFEEGDFPQGIFITYGGEVSPRSETSG